MYICIYNMYNFEFGNSDMDMVFLFFKLASTNSIAMETSTVLVYKLPNKVKQKVHGTRSY